MKELPGVPAVFIHQKRKESINSMRKKFIIAVFTLFILSFTITSSNALSIQENYDVIIAGAGTGGIAAAIQAASMGVNVLVVEPSGMLGGQAVAAGVPNMDDLSGQVSGIYEDFIGRIEEYYSARGKSIGTTYWGSIGKAFEPHVGQKILQDMARGEYAPDILYNSEIVVVGKDAQKINSVVIRTPEGLKSITCKILVDATEYGDILPLAGAEYRAGNSITPSINPEAKIQDITWTAVIRKYNDGVPEHLRPKNPLPGYDMARIIYAGYVTRDGSDFDGVYPVKVPVNFITHNAYRGLPDSFTPGNYDASQEKRHLITKSAVNWGNDFPGSQKLGEKYGLPVSYFEDKDTRKRLERDALIKTLHFIYYVQNEMGESWSVDEAEYGELQEAAKDLPEEWQRIARHLPPIPYVRESRRGVGNHTLTSTELYENSKSYEDGAKNNEFSDAIAIGCYILDLHHTGIDEDLESDLQEKGEYMQKHKPTGNFQVPMNILVPRDIDGLILAEKNLSMSRLVSGALRLQPITMMTGQAAGTLAALSVLKNLQPREVKAIHVQSALLKSGVNLSLCEYPDVPPEHKHYGSVQLSNLYRLLEPKEYPSIPSYDITYYAVDPKIIKAVSEGKSRARFGVDEPLSDDDRAKITARVKELTGSEISLPDGVTRGDAVEIAVRRLEKD